MYTTLRANAAIKYGVEKRGSFTAVATNIMERVNEVANLTPTKDEMDATIGIIEVAMGAGAKLTREKHILIGVGIGVVGHYVGTKLYTKYKNRCED